MRIHEIAEYYPALRLAKKIAAECQPYLSQISPTTRLWRGMYDSSTMQTSKLKCPVGRQPMSTAEHLHEFIDGWFLSNTGISYRSNAVFATGNPTMAAEFGRPFAIFPTGAFKFCWSPNVIDMTYDLVKPRSSMYSNLEDIAEPEDDEEEKEQLETMENALVSAKYIQNHLVDAIQSGNEIMIHCPTYFLVAAEVVDDVMQHLVELCNAQ